MIRLWARLIGALVLAFATAAVVLVETDVWTAPSWQIVVMAIVVGLAAAGQLVASAVQGRRDRSEAKLRREIDRFLAAALLGIQELTGLPIEQIGLTCWLVPPWYRWLPRGVRSTVRELSPPRLYSALPKPTLRRAACLRLRQTNAESAIRWTVEKGIIGVAWRRMQDVALDAYTEYGPLMGCDSAYWKGSVPEDVRLGLDHGEFERIAGKYGAVVVRPLIEGQTFLGCVTADVPWGDHFHLLNTDAVRAELGSAAEFIRNAVT